MSRKIIAVVLGATLMFGVVGVGAAPAGAQLDTSQVTQPDRSQENWGLTTLNLLVTQIDQVCSTLDPMGVVSPRLATVCAQLPSLKAVVDQINEVCANPVKPQYACSAGLIYGNRGNF